MNTLIDVLAGIGKKTAYILVVAYYTTRLLLKQSLPEIRKWRRRPGIGRYSAEHLAGSNEQCRRAKQRPDPLGKRCNHREFAIRI